MSENNASIFHSAVTGKMSYYAFLDTYIVRELNYKILNSTNHAVFRNKAPLSTSTSLSRLNNRKQ